MIINLNPDDLKKVNTKKEFLDLLKDKIVDGGD